MAAAATAVVLVVCWVLAAFVLGADDIAVFLASVMVVAAGARVAARLLDALLFTLDPVVVRPIAWALRRGKARWTAPTNGDFRSWSVMAA